MIGLIAAAVILLLMFGSVVAAGLPLAMAIGALRSAPAWSACRRPWWTCPTSRPSSAGVGPRPGHRLRVVDGDPVPRVAGPRTRPRIRDRGHARHRRTRGPRGRRHRHGEHAGVVRGGSVHPERHRRRHDGRHRWSCSPPPSPCSLRCWVTWDGASTGSGLPLGGRRAARVSPDGHLVPRAGWARWSRLVRRHSVLATVASVAPPGRLATPFLGVHFALPDAGNDPENTSNRQALRHAGRGLRAGPERAAARRRGPDVRRRRRRPPASPRRTREHGRHRRCVPAPPRCRPSTPRCSPSCPPPDRRPPRPRTWSRRCATP